MYQINFDFSEFPPAGKKQTLIRWGDEDRALAVAAARASGVSMEQFIRCIVVSAAKQVIAQAKGEVPPTHTVVARRIFDPSRPPGVKEEDV